MADAPETRDNMVIVPAEIGDHDAIRNLFYAGVDEGQVRDNDTGADIDNLEEGYFADEGASGFWVARVGDAIVGMIGVQLTSDNTAEIRRLRVADPYRRRGIGTLLVEHALRFCQKHSYLKVVLDIRMDRAPAISLFEKFGFKLSRSRDIDDRRMLDFYMDLYSEPEA